MPARRGFLLRSGNPIPEYGPRIHADLRYSQRRPPDKRSEYTFALPRRVKQLLTLPGSHGYR